MSGSICNQCNGMGFGVYPNECFSCSGTGIKKYLDKSNIFMWINEMKKHFTEKILELQGNNKALELKIQKIECENTTQAMFNSSFKELIVALIIGNMSDLDKERIEKAIKSKGYPTISVTEDPITIKMTWNDLTIDEIEVKDVIE